MAELTGEFDRCLKLAYEQKIKRADAIECIDILQRRRIYNLMKWDRSVWGDGIHYTRLKSRQEREAVDRALELFRAAK